MRTSATEQEMIDDFIRWNKAKLQRMDEHNSKTIPFYEKDFDCLKDTNRYERKRAVRRILTTFLSDWGI